MGNGEWRVDVYVKIMAFGKTIVLLWDNSHL
jgi:hypothetical protein